MQEFDITIQLSSGKEKHILFKHETKLLDIAKSVEDDYKDDIILALVDGKLRELNNTVKHDATISFITVADRDGRRTYRRSVTFLLQRAVRQLYGEKADLNVLHSIGEGYYCRVLVDDTPVEQYDVQKIVQYMNMLVEQDIVINKYSERTQHAMNMFETTRMHDKAKLLKYRRSSYINLYELDGVVDYFYGYMAPSTRMLKYFDVERYEDGFVLLFPGMETKKVTPLETSNKLFHILDESREWSRMLGIGGIGALNEAISAGRGQEIMLLQEALMEQKIGNLAARIARDRQKKFIMIAGPSSSGKTSFANRLSIQLIAKGLKPHPVSLDDYYVDREFCPKNPDGTFDFECLESIDVELFNRDMNSLLNGETISMPSFNFKTGKREYRGRNICIGEDDILVIEGIHGLNDKLSHLIAPEHKFKIYISALTQLNIDEHNPLSTTDERLIRRIVRDARTRGTSARETIAMWPSVRKGERQNIFPFQDGADEMFNSALVYELAVLKVYAEPLLFGIERDCPEYLEARRLLKFLDYFLPMPADGIPNNSLVREFVGGSCFNV